MDGVCAKCKVNDNSIGHSCKTRKQTLEDYKCEDNVAMMTRKRGNWAGPGPETCAICEIVL